MTRYIRLRPEDMLTDFDITVDIEHSVPMTPEQLEDREYLENLIKEDTLNA